MKKFLLLLFVCVASLASSKVVTVYYGPNHDGKYLELMLHGDEAVIWVRDSISTYSHSRVMKVLKEPRLWRVKYVRFNESDSALVYGNTFHNPVRLYYDLSSDLSTLTIRNVLPDAKLPTETLRLANYHVDYRAGEADFIGEPDLTIRISAPAIGGARDSVASAR